MSEPQCSCGGLVPFCAEHRPPVAISVPRESLERVREALREIRRATSLVLTGRGDDDPHRFETAWREVGSALAELDRLLGAE